MRHFVFLKKNGEYELVYSTSKKQAEKDMGDFCIAAFMYEEDAKMFVKLYNENWNNK